MVRYTCITSGFQKRLSYEIINYRLLSNPRFPTSHAACKRYSNRASLKCQKKAFTQNIYTESPLTSITKKKKRRHHFKLPQYRVNSSGRKVASNDLTRHINSSLANIPQPQPLVSTQQACTYYDNSAGNVDAVVPSTPAPSSYDGPATQRFAISGR